MNPIAAATQPPYLESHEPSNTQHVNASLSGGANRTIGLQPFDIDDTQQAQNSHTPQNAVKVIAASLLASTAAIGMVTIVFLPYSSNNYLTSFLAGGTLLTAFGSGFIVGNTLTHETHQTRQAGN